jgi:hypothetical protein
MPLRQKVWLALAAAIVLLVLVWVAPAAGRPLAFITLFTVAGMWLLGFTRAPAPVRRARREAAARPRRLAEPHPQVVEREFRVRAKRSGQLVAYVASAISMAGGVWLVVAGTADPRLGRDLVVLGAIVIGFGAFLGYFIWRAARFTIRTDSAGIEADVLMGRRHIAWDDIVIVCKEAYMWGGYARVLEQRVAYTRDRFIALPPTLEQVDELVAIVLANALTGTSRG